MPQDQNAIAVQDLVRMFRRKGHPPVQAVDGLSFLVRQGEIFGLLGPNGAGKTTTLKILTTLIPPTSGTATILGHDVITQPLEVRNQICVVVQQNAIDQYLSVRNNFRTFGRFHGMSSSEIEPRIDRLSELFGLREYLNERGIDVSGGTKRRVQVAKIFMVDKPIVFLDEATTGMDTFSKRRTIDAIMEESRKGRTIVLTTHVLDEAEELCDSVVIINHGKSIAQGSIDDVKSMSLRLYYLILSLERVSPEVLEVIRRRKPMKLEVRNNRIEVTVRDEAVALEILGAVKQNGPLRHFQITSASLEDAFVELIDKGRAAAE